ncbi:MAG TPA: hypothetical protein VGE52_22275, partial [Pirellulales bacterium]
RTLGLGAVNLDPLESNLARVPAATLAEKLSSLGARTASVNALALDEPAVKSGGRALWGWCFASAVVLLGLELALLSWWKR